MKQPHPAHSSRAVPLPLAPPRVRRPGEAPIACLDCGHCCTYLAVGINAPRTPRYATDVLWYLYHEDVSVHRDVTGEWAVVFQTRCRNLGAGSKCSVYLLRPHICRAFDNDGCEVNSPDTRDRVFTTPREFLEFLRGWQPRTYLTLRKRYIPEEHLPPGADPVVRARRRKAAASAPVRRRPAARRRVARR